MVTLPKALWMLHRNIKSLFFLRVIRLSNFSFLRALSRKNSQLTEHVKPMSMQVRLVSCQENQCMFTVSKRWVSLFSPGCGVSVDLSSEFIWASTHVAIFFVIIRCDQLTVPVKTRRAESSWWKPFHNSRTASLTCVAMYSNSRKQK